MPDAPTKSPSFKKSPGNWSDVWKRFRKKYFPLLALVYVIALVVIGVASPLIVGAKPVVCKYKGRLYFPCVGYYNDRWENPIFIKDRFRNQYYKSLKEKDPNSWAIWPLIYQDPARRIRTGEWPDQPENPVGIEGRPNKYNRLGTTSKGVDVLAHLVHGARMALLVGFVSMGIASLIGITLGAIAGYYGGWADTVLSRLTEIVMCLPTLAIILALISIIEKPTIWHTMTVIGATGWTAISRLTGG
jgi:peptide/nickel transport system permease protein